MLPIPIFSKLIPTSRQGLRKCRELWPEYAIDYERTYNILLAIVLLVAPLIILSVAYIMITRTLYVSIRNERDQIFGSSLCNREFVTAVVPTATLSPSASNFNMSLCCRCHSSNDGSNKIAAGHCPELKFEPEMAYQLAQQPYRQQRQNSCQRQEQAPKRFHDAPVYPPHPRPLSLPQHGIEQRQLLASFHGRKHLYANIVGTTTATPSSTSMTVINLPQQQRFQLHQQRQQQRQQQQQLKEERGCRKRNSIQCKRFTNPALRRSNETKNLASKKRVVKMLFVLVLEFFICWTPLYIINTLAMFIGPTLYEYIDYTSISVLQLLAYSSSCCNPITYCFMNAGFRRAFIDTFRGLPLAGTRYGRKRPRSTVNLSIAANSGATMTTILDSPKH